MKPLKEYRDNITLLLAIIGATTGIIMFSLQFSEFIEFNPRIEITSLDIYDASNNYSDYIEVPHIRIRFKLENKGKIQATLEGMPELIVHFDQGNVGKRYPLSPSSLKWDQDCQGLWPGCEDQLVLEPLEVANFNYFVYDLGKDIHLGKVPDVRSNPDRISFELKGDSTVGTYSILKRGLRIENPFYWKLDRYEKDIRQYNKELMLNPDSAEIYGDIGWAFYMLGKYNRSIDAYNKAIKLDNSSPNYWYLKGIAFKDSGNFKEAIRCFDKAIFIINNDFYNDFRPAGPEWGGWLYSELWYNRGVALSRLNRHKEAIDMYDIVLENSSSYGLAWKKKGESFLALGRIEEAEDAFSNFDEYVDIEYNWLK